MDKTAYIHFGMPKAGSTALQKSFASARALLLENGILYPGTADDHVALCAMFHPLGERHHYFRKTASLSPRADCESLLQEACRFDGHVVFSSEYLFSIGRPGATRLRRILNEAGFAVRFVSYIRHPVDAAISEIQQRVKNTDASLFGLFEDPKLHSFRTSIEPIVEAVGKDNVAVRNFESAKVAGTARDLIGLMGFPELCKRLPDIRANESLSMDGALLADIHNTYSRLHGVRLFPKSLIFEMAGGKFNIPESAKERVRSAGEGDLLWLQQAFGIELKEAAAANGYRDGFSQDFQDRLAGAREARAGSGHNLLRRLWRAGASGKSR